MPISVPLIGKLTRKYCNHSVDFIRKLNPPWDVLFFGTDEFSVASLKALQEQL